MREHDGRLALQRLVVPAGEAFTILRSRQQALHRVDERLRVRRRRRRFVLDCLIDAHHELRQRMQPRKPGIMYDELQERRVRRHPAAIQLVGHTRIVQQHFM